MYNKNDDFNDYSNINNNILNFKFVKLLMIYSV